jgi:hypothetical protein
MNLNNNAHPYGVVIAGNGMGSDQQSYFYCAADGNANFIGIRSRALSDERQAR